MRRQSFMPISWVVTMIGQEGLDTARGHELSTQRRRVEQFTVGFAESLQFSILDNQNATNRLCELIYSTDS